MELDLTKKQLEMANGNAKDSSPRVANMFDLTVPKIFRRAVQRECSTCSTGLTCALDAGGEKHKKTISANAFSPFPSTVSRTEHFVGRTWRHSATKRFGITKNCRRSDYMGVGGSGAPQPEEFKGVRPL